MQGLVVPVIAAEIVDLVGGARRHFGGEAVRVALVDLFAPFRLHAELVEGSFAESRDEELPDAAGDVLLHGMTAAIPSIEVADDADAGGVGGPDGEVDAIDTVHVAQLRAESAVASPVSALSEQIQIVVAQQRRKGIRIVNRHLVPSMVGNAQHIWLAPLGFRSRANRFEQPGRVNTPHRLRGAVSRV